MNALSLRRKVRGQRGQVMVLGALGVMLVALMMLITLNVGKAVYEKIRIQQLADAEAFSTATLEARSFNFFAYTNRANIAGLVAAASLHGYMSLASTVPGLFEAGMQGFLWAAGAEFALCCSCPYCSCVIHCIHGLRDLNTAWHYHSRAGDFADAVKELDKDFIATIEKLDWHMKSIAAQAQLMRAWVSQKITMNKVADNLKGKYSEGSENLSHIGPLNLIEYNKVFEGKAKIRKWLGTEISNGTRFGKFVHERNVSHLMAGIDPRTWKEWMYDIPKQYRGGVISTPLWHRGESRTIEKAENVPSEIARDDNGPDGEASGGADKGGTFHYGGCVSVGGGWYHASIGSGPDGGEHECSSVADCCDDESAHKFKCLGDDGLATHNCFTVFKSNPEAGEDFGQPRVYAALDSDLRRTRGQGGKIAWEVTESDSGTVSMDFGDVHNTVQQEMGGPGRKVQLSANPDAAWGPEGDNEKLGKGVAVSKALVYYHHPDWEDNQSGWKEAPNFFNPYWKAKLQPFRNTTELVKALGQYSAKYGAMLLGGLVVKPPLP